MSETWKHKTRAQQLPAKTQRENIKKAQERKLKSCMKNFKINQWRSICAAVWVNPCNEQDPSTRVGSQNTEEKAQKLYEEILLILAFGDQSALQFEYKIATKLELEDKLKYMLVTILLKGTRRWAVTSCQPEDEGKTWTFIKLIRKTLSPNR